MKNIVIVVTGGPSGGKTTLIHALQKEFGAKINVVPEAATILYSGGFPRRKSSQAKLCTQRAISLTQGELEDMINSDSKGQTLICDRGRLDSVAYWPEDADVDFFSSLATSLQKEIDRYDWVLHLDTAAASAFDSSNPLRTESHTEAMALNQKLLKAWSSHPRRVIIPHFDDFLAKLTYARSVVQKIMNGESYEAIKA